MGINRNIVASAILALALTLGVSHLQAQSAPVPPELSTAKTVFLADAGEEANNLSERAYTQVYSGLSQWGHYQLAPSPSSADLIFELHYLAPLATPDFINGTNFPSYSFRLRLDIFDSSTHTELWSVTEFIDTSRHKGNFDPSFNDAVNLLLGDIKALSSGQFPSATAASISPTTKKPHLSQEKQ
jgi:hypothetical protein